MFAKLFATAAFWLLPTLGWSATLHPSGAELIDTGTNLAWLNLTATEGQSVNDATAANGAYRVATLNEVMTLFGNAGLPTAAQVNFTPRSDAVSLAALLGETLSSALLSGSRGLALGTGGLLFTDPSVTYTAIFGNTYRGANDAGWESAANGAADRGVFLVRDITPVPLSGSSGFLILGGAWFLVMRRRTG